MLTIHAEPSQTSANRFPETATVTLADGERFSLTGLALEDLAELQWQQEQLFAHAIAELPKNSRERAELTGQAYDTICTILAAQCDNGEPLVMGLDKRYVRLVLKLLNSQVNHGIAQPRFFEIGFGSGLLLKHVSDHGFAIAGAEISTAMHDQATNLLGGQHAEHLFCGDLRQVNVADLVERPTLIYWNDVFEHICPDEIADYLAHIYEMLEPGGKLLTITPNWLLRPSDVTRGFCPLRTEARGLHFKEYRLAEVSRLLREAGFRRVATPLVVSKQRIYLCGDGLRAVKQFCEPLIDKLPIKPAHLLCRGFGLSYTIATK